MSNTARIAVGAAFAEVDHQPLMWALLDVLEESGVQVQTFLSQSCFDPRDGARSITGRSNRHLDSWLMSPDVCHEIFCHGAEGCDLAVVEGHFSSEQVSCRGGTLDQLCDWLELPRIVVLDATQLADCRIPRRPRNVDGILLDRVGGGDAWCRHQTALESLWGVPVLGLLDEVPALRAIIDRLPRGVRPSRDLCRVLGRHLARRLNVDKLLSVAARSSIPGFRSRGSRLFRPQSNSRESSITVAVALDDAFDCYFPDTLDLLEMQGATIRDFSPLRDEALPPNTDLVYLGCGHVEQHAEPLSGNFCMRMSLQQYIGRGGRTYAEGDGMAYLCRHLVTPSGQHWPMVGAFAARARRNPNPDRFRPLELTLAQRTWLGDQSSQLRGYLNNHWLIEPCGRLLGLAREPGHRYDLLGRGQTIGSQLSMNFATQPAVLESFFQPHPTAARVSASGQST